MIDLDRIYRAWLRAAYIYYITPGDDTRVSDYQWDQWGRVLRENLSELPADEYPVVHRQEFLDGSTSLFWLKRVDYPDWAFPR